MNPLISVIVPIYKVEAYLPRCIDSIIFQTYDNLEIILVDDGSPDGCGKICDSYAEQDSRIRVIHKENAGLGYARNSGLEICTGKYIMFVDSDDYLKRDCVEILYHRLINDSSDIAISNYIKVFDDGLSKAGTCKCFEKDVVTRHMLLETFYLHCVYVTAWGKLYKRSVFENIFFPKLRCGEDTWIFGDVIERCNTISFVNIPLYNYYQRSDSILHTKDIGKCLDSINADLRLAEFLMKENCIKNSANVYASCIDRALSIDKIEDRLKYFKSYFDRETRDRLLKETDLKTKIKWYALYLPYSNRIRKFIVKIKNKFK